MAIEGGSGTTMPNEKPYQTEIPDKLYFKIGEVSKITGLASHVLRFWETEFRKINPRRTDSGQRSYTKKDIEIILEIKHLLYNKKFTIDGARRYIKDKSEPEIPGIRQFLADLKTELTGIKDFLDSH
jgi:DNA-binding transcriptional MerR regulator